LTDVDAMVALTKPEYSGPGTWADADMLDVCNFGGNVSGSATLPSPPLSSPATVMVMVRSIKWEAPARPVAPTPVSGVTRE